MKAVLLILSPPKKHDTLLSVELNRGRKGGRKIGNVGRMKEEKDKREAQRDRREDGRNRKERIRRVDKRLEGVENKKQK